MITKQKNAKSLLFNRIVSYTIEVNNKVLSLNHTSILTNLIDDTSSRMINLSVNKNNGESANVSCKICESTSNNFLGQVPGYKKGPRFNIYECINCLSGFANSNSRLDNSIYELIYKNVANVPGYSRYHKIATDILNVENPLEWLQAIEGTYYSCIEIIKQDAPENKDELCIVELGCGQGYLTYALNQAGYQCFGIDISETAINLAKERYGDYFYCGALSEFLLSSGRKPTHIICTELIEHIEDPKAFIKNITSLMSEKAAFIITTPNKLDINNSIWDTELPPIHLWYIAQKGLSLMAHDLLLEINFFNFDNFYSDKNVFFKKYRNKQTKFISTFNENNELINHKNQKSFLDYLKKYLHFLNPLYLIDKVLFGKKYSSIRRNDQYSEFLCAIFKKSL